MSEVKECEECGIEYYSETIVERESFRHVFPGIAKLESELAEARAEIERLNGILDGAIDNKKSQDALIKQMLELLQSAVEDWAKRFNYEENPEHGGWAVGVGRILNEMTAKGEK